MNVLMGYEITQTAGNLLEAGCWYCDLAGAVDWAPKMYIKRFHIKNQRYVCLLTSEVPASRRL
jgi:hypothetical protein